MRMDMVNIRCMLVVVGCFTVDMNMAMLAGEAWFVMVAMMIVVVTVPVVVLYFFMGM